MRRFAEVPTRPNQTQPGAALPGEQGAPSSPVIYVVDDDFFTRSAVRAMLGDTGWRVEDFSACEAFLADFRPDLEACLVLDVHLPGMGGLELLERLRDLPRQMPVVVISGSAVISDAVRALKTGASDFLQKPLAPEALVASLIEAFSRSRDAQAVASMQQSALDHLAELTPRQREIMSLVLAGHPSKIIAADLGISRRTVENHRASIMHKTGVRSLPALAKLALSSVWKPGEAMLGS